MVNFKLFSSFWLYIAQGMRYNPRAFIYARSVPA